MQEDKKNTQNTLIVVLSVLKFVLGTKGMFKKESTRKLSNLNSQWTKTLYLWNNFKNIAFVLHFSRAKDVSSNL